MLPMRPYEARDIWEKFTDVVMDVRRTVPARERMQTPRSFPRAPFRWRRPHAHHIAALLTDRVQKLRDPPVRERLLPHLAHKPSTTRVAWVQSNVLLQLRYAHTVVDVHYVLLVRSAEITARVVRAKVAPNAQLWRYTHIGAIRNVGRLVNRFLLFEIQH